MSLKPNYVRPKSSQSFSKNEKLELVEQYFLHYAQMASSDASLLNQKLPREVFEDVLDQIGGLLLKETARLASEPGPLKDFLKLNSLPLKFDGLLPLEFRAFCLGLNALKQWVSAEQQATDRYILGGTSRDLLRKKGLCVITGKEFGGACELHHPVRDGRLPIPLSKDAHSRIENQIPKHSQIPDKNFEIISRIRSENRNSWKNLRRGCQELAGEPVNHSTKAVGNGARSFARKVQKETGLDFLEILEILNSRDLGITV